jgi:hypothetical protein
MSDFKTRLLEEKAQLDERLEKLQAFQISDGFQNIAAVQQTLLNVQANAMATYSQVLLERIAWLEQPVGASEA